MLSPAANRSTVPSVPPLYDCAFEDEEEWAGREDVLFAASDELSNVVSSEAVSVWSTLFELWEDGEEEEVSAIGLHPESTVRSSADAIKKAGRLYRK